MRRKDGQRKRRARRAKPEWEHGFRENPALSEQIHPTWLGQRNSQHTSVISLFAGCGGLDLGIAGGFSFLDEHYPQHPFDIVHAVDASTDAVEAYRLNLGPHAEVGDLTEIPARDLPRADVLMGGFPCQPFSSSGRKVGVADHRGQLYRVLVDYMAEHRPHIVIGENVPYLKRLDGGRHLRAILNDFEAVGYRFVVWDLLAPDYGLPQSRRRLFLIGVREDIEGFPVCPKPTHEGAHVSIDVALADLQDVVDESVTNQSQYFVATRATAGGGQGDHTNQVGKVAYCIRANSRGRIQFHHALDRRLTVRECARLQSFPDEFVFPFSTQRNLTLVGNAVPPILGHHVGRAVANFVAGQEVAQRPTTFQQHELFPAVSSSRDLRRLARASLRRAKTRKNLG